MTQLPLIPVRVRTCWNPSTETASRPRFATCDDRLDYVIKGDEEGNPVRANEWICTWLARTVGIAVATPAIVQDLDKKLLFGSQICGEDTNDNMGAFTHNVLTSEHLEQIWRTFVFDLFIRNPDRHINNYKFFLQNRHIRMISFDFGDSLFKYWPNLSLPLPQSCNTIECFRFIQSKYCQINLDIADDVLSRLANLDGAAMVSTVKSLPRGWLSATQSKEFMAWFGGRPRRERITKIREGLRDGSYL